jgi:hypothetical protein
VELLVTQEVQGLMGVVVELVLLVAPDNQILYKM